MIGILLSSYCLSSLIVLQLLKSRAILMFTVVQAAPSMQHRIPPPLFEKGGVQNLCGLSFVDPLTLFNSRNIHHIVHMCQGLCEHGSLFKGGGER